MVKCSKFFHSQWNLTNKTLIGKEKSKFWTVIKDKNCLVMSSDSFCLGKADIVIVYFYKKEEQIKSLQLKLWKYQLSSDYLANWLHWHLAIGAGLAIPIYMTLLISVSCLKLRSDDDIFCRALRCVTCNVFCMCEFHNYSKSNKFLKIHISRSQGGWFHHSKWILSIKINSWIQQLFNNQAIAFHAMRFAQN